MDNELQKHLFGSHFENDMQCDLIKNKAIFNDFRLNVFNHRCFLFATATVSLFSMIFHWIMLIEFHNLPFDSYFACSLTIILLQTTFNGIIFVKICFKETHVLKKALLSMCFIPIGLILPYILVFLSDEFIYRQNLSNLEKKYESKLGHRLRSIQMQGLFQGIPNTILMVIWLYNIGNAHDINMLYAKISLLSSMILVMQSYFINHLKNFLDKFYNFITILSIIIDIILLIIMILFYYRTVYDHSPHYAVDVLIAKIWLYNGFIVSILIFMIVFIYSLPLYVLRNHNNGCCYICGYLCGIICCVIPLFILFEILLSAMMAISTYSWFIIFIRKFAINSRLIFVKFVVGTHLPLNAKLNKKEKQYRLCQMNRMLNMDNAKNDIENEEYIEYLNEEYGNDNLEKISWSKISKFSASQFFQVVHKHYKSYIESMKEPNDQNQDRRVYNLHEPVAYLLLLCTVSSVLKIVLPFAVFISLILHYNFDEFNEQEIKGTNFLFVLMSFEMVLIVVLVLCLLFCIDHAYYGYHMVQSTPHNKMYAKHVLESMSAQQVLSEFIGNRDIARIIVDYIGFLDPEEPTCPRYHTLKQYEFNPGTFDSNHNFPCAICRKTPEKGDDLHGCKRCKHDLCSDCYNSRSHAALKEGIDAAFGEDSTNDERKDNDDNEEAYEGAHALIGMMVMGNRDGQDDTMRDLEAAFHTQLGDDTENLATDNDVGGSPIHTVNALQRPTPNENDKNNDSDEHNDLYGDSPLQIPMSDTNIDSGDNSDNNHNTPISVLP